MKQKQPFNGIGPEESIFLRRATEGGAVETTDVIGNAHTLVSDIQEKTKGHTITAVNMRTVFDELTTYGFDEKQITRMCGIQPGYLTLTWESLKSRFDGFESYGFTRAEIISMFATHPSIITYPWEGTHAKLRRLEQIGISKETLLKGARKNMAFLASSEDTLFGTKEKTGIVTGLLQYGFTGKNIDAMVGRYPQFLSRSWAAIHPTFLALEEYGFSPDRIITMCTSYPNIVNFSWERTHGTSEQPGILLSMEQNGFTKSQIIDWCEQVPAMLTYSWERIREQLEFAVKNDLPICKQLFVFSPKKTAWRFEFLKKNGYSTGIPTLYRGHKEFVQRYGEDYEQPIAGESGTKKE